MRMWTPGAGIYVSAWGRFRIDVLDDTLVPRWPYPSRIGIDTLRAMRIIAKRTLRTYWEREPNAEQPLKAWYAIARKADWSSPAEVKAVYGHASIVGNNRVVFNIGGNRYRLIIRFDYPRRIGFVRFVGTHAEYDRIDASQV